LIKEARAASRRRRLGWCIVFIVFALVTTLIVASTVGNSKPTRQIGSGNKNGKEVPWPSCRVRRLACPFQMASRERSAGRRSSLAHDHECEFKVVSYERVPRLVVYGPRCGDPISLGAPPHADFPLTSKLPKPFALARTNRRTSGSSNLAAWLERRPRRPKLLSSCQRRRTHTSAHAASPNRTLRRPSARQANPIGISPIEPTLAGPGIINHDYDELPDR